MESNGALLVNLIPDIALIIGEQPPVPDLPPQDAKNRFQRVFSRFIGVFSRPEHPLVLFLDDLQWLDIPTLDLLERLVGEPGMHHLLLVGAYRDNETDLDHPLPRRLASIRRTGAAVTEIVLAPLALNDLGRLVGDALHMEPEQARPLAALVHEKTAGNPFFAIQFITALAEEGLLAFISDGMCWKWDLERIRAKGFTDNVADLMAGKLNRLPEQTQEVLKQFACLGVSTRLGTLSLVHGMPEEDVRAALWPSIRTGLVFYQETDRAYAFLHDRIQEAVYALIPETSRIEMHLRAGRLLAAALTAEETTECGFVVVSQLNRAIGRITDPDEKASLVKLNIQSAKRAKAAIAYHSARTYLTYARLLLAPDAWTRRYEETLDLYLGLSECTYLVGDFADADALFDLILEKAASDLDRVKVYSLRLKLYQVAGKYEEGVAVALEALRLFGVDFPESDEKLHEETAAELQTIRRILGSRPIADLLDAPRATDPVMQAVINLLVEAGPCIYNGRPPLFPLFPLKATKLSIWHGNTEQSSLAYSGYAVLLVSVVGDIPSAFQFSKMALSLNEKFNNVRLHGALLLQHGGYINFWRRHIATGMPILEQAFQACMEVGDLLYAGLSAFQTVWQMIEKGDPLDDIVTQSEKYAVFACRSHNAAIYETIRLEQRFVACLKERRSIH